MPGETELRTQRLLLRAYREEDIPALVALIGAREVAATTLRIPHPYTADDAREFLAQQKRHAMPHHFAICLAVSGELVGGIGLEIERAHDRAELGYWIGVPYWRNGYCTEAAAEMIRHGLEDLRLNRMFAHHFVENPASGRVLRNIGMKYEGRLRQHVKKWGRYIDLEHYGLLAEEGHASCS